MIDTHVHIIEPERFEYPWLAGVPGLAGSWTIGSWTAEAKEAQVRKGIFMEVDVAATDRSAETARFSSIATEPESPLLGVIAACRPESATFERELDAIEHPKLLGLRRVLHVADEGTMQSASFVPNLKLAGQRDLTFDLCLRPDQLVAATELLDAAPDTQFVLDHCGNPPIGAEAFEDWKRAVRALSYRPNLFCKISGLVNHIPASADPEIALKPVIDWAIDCFGSHRLLFGGDWPVCRLAGFDLGAWVELARRLTADWSDSERQSLFEGNAASLYGLAN